MRGVKKQGTMSKMVLGLKKGRKKFLLKDSLNRDKDQSDAGKYKGKFSTLFTFNPSPENKF